MSYVLHLVVICTIYLGLAFSLRLLVVDSGMHSFAHAVFYGVGAYSYAIVATRSGAPTMWALLLAVAAAVPACIVLGWILTRLRKDDMVIGSIALQICFSSILLNFTSLTRGPFGIPGIPALVSISGNPVLPYAVGLTALAVLCGVIVKSLPERYLGLALRSARDSDRFAQSLGLRVESLRLAAILAAAVVCVLFGAAYASYAGYVDPSAFSLQESIVVYTIVLVAGSRAGGALLGVIVFVMLPEALRFLGSTVDHADQLRLAAVGFVLLSMPFVEGAMKQWPGERP